GGDRAAVLLRVAREFPGSRAALAGLGELARLSDQAGRPGAAAEAYRLWIRRSGQDPRRSAEAVPALIGLASAYERQRCWEAARATWEFLAEHHGQRTAPALGNGPLREVIAGRLQAREYRALAAAGLPSRRPEGLALPWRRTWATAAGRLLVPARNAL